MLFFSDIARASSRTAMKIRQPIKPQVEQQTVEQPPKPVLPELVVFVLTALMITLFGLIMLYSTSFVTEGSSYFTKQMVWMIISAIAAIGAVTPLLEQTFRIKKRDLSAQYDAAKKSIELSAST